MTVSIAAVALSVHQLVAGARELLAQMPPAAAPRTWMDLFGGWIATKSGMLDTLLAMIKSGEITHAQTRTEILTAITEILDACRAAGDLRADITAEDIAASLLGIFTVPSRPSTKTGRPPAEHPDGRATTASLNGKQSGPNRHATTARP